MRYSTWYVCATELWNTRSLDPKNSPHSLLFRSFPPAILRIIPSAFPTGTLLLSGVLQLFTLSIKSHSLQLNKTGVPLPLQASLFSAIKRALPIFKSRAFALPAFSVIILPYFWLDLGRWVHHRWRGQIKQRKRPKIVGLREIN